MSTNTCWWLPRRSMFKQASSFFSFGWAFNMSIDRLFALHRHDLCENKDVSDVELYFSKAPHSSSSMSRAVSRKNCTRILSPISKCALIKIHFDEMKIKTSRVYFTNLPREKKFESGKIVLFTFSTACDVYSRYGWIQFPCLTAFEGGMNFFFLLALKSWPIGALP